jgi:hypothetical protein
MWEYAVVERSWPNKQPLVDFLNLMDRTGWELVEVVAKPGSDHTADPEARAWFDCIFRRPRPTS